MEISRMKVNGASTGLDERVRAALAAGESYSVEFKRDKPKINDRDLVEAIVCLANGHGGLLLLARLVSDGKLLRIGERRGTAYLKP